MSIDKLIENVTPEAYASMQSAIETGRWPNGVPLSEDQRENCLQIVIAYDNRHKDTEERVGYLPTKPKDSPTRNNPQPVRILEDNP
jgi:uncharacterized protein YeaC (DUF1315 family)